MWGVFKEGKGLVKKFKTYNTAKVYASKLRVQWLKKHAGSGLSMFNAIWFKKLEDNPSKALGKWLPAKAVRIRKKKGGGYSVDVRR